MAFRTVERLKEEPFGGLRTLQEAYLSLRPQLLKRLDALVAEPSLAPSAVLLRATGHSLGGVLAMLACARLKGCGKRSSFFKNEMYIKSYIYMLYNDIYI